MSAAFVLAAGGTGGHLFPAEALAIELVERGRQVHLLTDSRADAFAAGVNGVEVHCVRAGRLGGGPVRSVYGLAELAAGVVQARRLLRRLSPQAVVGFGGYPSVPTMLAAASLGLATSFTNRTRCSGAPTGCWRLGYDGSPPAFPRLQECVRPIAPAPSIPGILCGRQSWSLASPPIRPPQPGGPVELLVLGGSQGARVFSEIVPSALAASPPVLRAALKVSQQARPEDLAAVARAYAEDRHRRGD